MTVRSMRAAAADGDRGAFLIRRESRATEPLVTQPRAVTPRARAQLLLARELYASRRRRERFYSADLFGEPTWDILLDLYVARREDRRVPTTSACIGANVPPTTALRWLRILETRGLVEREDDGRDGRRTFVRLSLHGMAAMEGYLDSCLVALRPAMAEAEAANDEAAQDDPLAEAAQ